MQYDLKCHQIIVVRRRDALSHVAVGMGSISITTRYVVSASGEGHLVMGERTWRGSSSVVEAFVSW
jgi:hypothetical protein